MTDNITDNAKAILLLCGRFGPDDDEQTAPLNIREYDDLGNWLWSKEWEPSDLLREGRQEALDEAFAPIEPGRMRALLKRGGAMALAVENWTNKGLWVLCRSDGQYPLRLKRHLKRQAPPILYGAGNSELLELGGVAVAGSRDVDAEGGAFARRLGQCAAEARMQLVSGAARGVDELAMHGAFSAGGKVTGVMADGLLKTAVSGKYREGIREGRLLLISPYNPLAGFSIGNAMGRNKIIYAMADCAVVVSSGFREGGTWAGAKEELERPGGRPVFVRSGPGIPKGNEELLKLGGMPVTDDDLREKGLRWMHRETAVPEPEA